MSANNLFRLSGIPKAVLSNGLGRFIPQLQRITLKFCKSHGSSRGMREFIEQDLIDYVNNNTSVVVYVKPRRHKTPVIVAEYLNGERKWLSVRNFSREEIKKWVYVFKGQSGQNEKILLQHYHTNYPSIQGPWSPFYNRKPQLNTTTYPDMKLSQYISEKPTASEKLVEIFEKQKSEVKQ